MKRFLQITTITVSIFTTSFAQPSTSLYFTTAFPMGEFKDFSSTTGLVPQLNFSSSLLLKKFHMVLD